jgi:hypothetical protein
MYYSGCKLFGDGGCGYGIVDPDIIDVKVISSKNIGTGFGKKKELYEKIQDNVVKQNVSKKEQLKQLLNHLVSNKDSSSNNEVVMDVKDNGKIGFIFFNNASRKEKFNALYMQKAYQKVFGDRLPIYDISTDKPIRYVCNYDEFTKLCDSNKEMVRNSPVLQEFVREVSNDLKIKYESLKSNKPLVSKEEEFAL